LIGRKIGLAQSKVAKSNMACGVKEDVLWFEVSVYDIVLVQMLEGKSEFGDVETSSLLAKPGLPL